jgi:hypothetical protein
MHVGNMGVIILIINTCLAQFDYNNKIIDKALPTLGEFNQVVEPFQNGRNIIKPHHYFQITKQFQIMGNLCIIINISMHL